jgi:hypothetical protein
MTGGWVQKVTLTPEQREMIVNELSEMKRSPKLRDSAVQAQIIKRIERALTKIGAGYWGPVPASSADRLEALSKAKNETDVQVRFSKLHQVERDLLDLVATKGVDMQAQAAQAAASLRIGRGEKYGDRRDKITGLNKSRFLADQLADLFEIGLGIRAGHGDKSSFRRLLEVTCYQVGLPILNRDAVEAITAKYRQNTPS